MHSPNEMSDTITDADREAAALAVGFVSLPDAINESIMFGISTPRIVRLGELTPHFARHRTTAEAAKDAIIAELEQKLAASEKRFNDCRIMLLATGASLAEARKEIEQLPRTFREIDNAG